MNDVSLFRDRAGMFSFLVLTWREHSEEPKKNPWKKSAINIPWNPSTISHSGTNVRSIWDWTQAGFMSKVFRSVYRNLMFFFSFTKSTKKRGWWPPWDEVSHSETSSCSHILSWTCPVSMNSLNIFSLFVVWSCYYLEMIHFVTHVEVLPCGSVLLHPWLEERRCQKDESAWRTQTPLKCQNCCSHFSFSDSVMYRLQTRFDFLPDLKTMTFKYLAVFI